MNRRKFVLTGGTLCSIGIAGCLGDDETDTDEEIPEETTDEIPEEEPEEDDRLEFDDDSYEGVRVEPYEQDFSLVYSVEILSNETEDSPLTLQISLTNASDDTTYEYSERRDALFWLATVSEDFETYPAEGVESNLVYDDSTGGWALDEAFIITSDYQMEQIEPQETHTETIVVVNSPDTTEVTPITTHESIEVSNEFNIVDHSEAESGEFISGELSEWGFTLLFEE